MEPVVKASVPQPRGPEHRMYVDEVGNADMGASQDPNHRYLSLTGIIIRLDHAREQLVPAFQDLKRRYFARDPDKQIIFHRKELVNHKYPFDALRDPAVCALFDKEMLSLMDRLEYFVITAVIDKQAHHDRYGKWASHPYHYCLEVLLERYVMHLEKRRSCGDVMAESRGGREDRELSDAFRGLLLGTERMPASQLKERLTSKKLKLQKKADDIAGLQLADLIAHPSYRSIKLLREGLPVPADFGGRVAEILERSKYRRSWFGVTQGFGRKWLP